jgi:hypothetical protein
MVIDCSKEILNGNGINKEGEEYFLTIELFPSGGIDRRFVLLSNKPEIPKDIDFSITPHHFFSRYLPSDSNSIMNNYFNKVFVSKTVILIGRVVLAGNIHQLIITDRRGFRLFYFYFYFILYFIFRTISRYWINYIKYR